jgi:alpha-tubulin suppressor-like RCC1 family protein
MIKITLFVFLLTQLVLSLKADLPSGAVISWGRDINGQATGVPTGALSNNSTGLVFIAGQALKGTVAISAGTTQGLALQSDGTVFGWGCSLAGEVTGSGAVPGNIAGEVKIAGNVLSNAISVSAGSEISLACKSDGTVAFWGKWQKSSTNQTESGVISGLNDIVAVSAGLNSGFAIRRDHSVVYLAGGDLGGIKTIAGLSNIVAVAAGRDYYLPSLALRDDGMIFRLPLRRGDQGIQIVASNAVKIAVGNYGHCLTLQRDSTVYGWNENYFGEATGIPFKISHAASGLVTVGRQVLTNVVDIAAGSRCSLALKSDGSVVAWGRMDNARSPANVPEGLSNVVAVAAGGEFCLAITTNEVVANKFRQK